MGGLSKCNRVHADPLVGCIEEAQHHLELFAIFAIYFDALSLHWSQQEEVTESAQEVMNERDCHANVN